MAGGGRGAQPVAAAVRQALAPLAAAPAASAIVTDFDGTLAPIVDDPADAQAPDRAADLLTRLAVGYRVVAVVSGRSVSFLSDRLFPTGQGGGNATTGRADRLPAVQLVGLHGLEWSGGNGEVVAVPGAERWRSVISDVAGRLSARVPPGVEVEVKGLAVTIHWRRAPQSAAQVAGLVSATSAACGLRTHPGRMSVELRPPLEFDKGTAIRQLVAGCSAACFFGDDVGDLPAFAALADLGAEEGMATTSVAVVDGESAPAVVQAADVVLSGPTDVLAVLDWLAEAAEDQDGAGPRPAG
jgi:trehalose 6-phosphate phosphatase